jgi:sugar phosphate isomerase/epimerase
MSGHAAGRSDGGIRGTDPRCMRGRRRSGFHDRVGVGSAPRGRERNWLPIHVVEAASKWANGEPADAAEEAAYFAAQASEHGAGLIGAVCLEPDIEDMGRARANLAELAKAAAGANSRMCLEFLPGTGVATLATAWDLVEPLGPDATVLLDTWHWTRQPGGPAFEVLSRIPGDRIGYVQLCDVSPESAADLMTEIMTGRMLPGEGIVDFPRLMTALNSMGAAPYVATEIFNPQLIEKLGVGAAARAMKAAAEQALRPA